VLERNSEVLSRENFPSCETFFETLDVLVLFILLWLEAVRSRLKFRALTFLHVKNLSFGIRWSHGKLCNVIPVLSEGTACFQLLYCKA